MKCERELHELADDLCSDHPVHVLFVSRRVSFITKLFDRRNLAPVLNSKCPSFCSLNVNYLLMAAALLLSSRELNAVHIPAVFFVLDTKQYSQTCIKRHRIKRSPSIKRSVFKVPEITSLDVL